MIRILTALMLATLLTLQGCGADSARASIPPAPATLLARGTVDVEGGLLPVLPTRDGHISAVLAVRGQTVEPGTLIARLADGPEQADVDIAQAELQRARAELAAGESRLSLLAERFSRVKEAESAGAESGSALDDLRLQMETQRSGIPVAKAAVSGAEARLRSAVLLADGNAVRAPAAGRIVQVSTSVGSLVSARDATPLFLIRPIAALIVRATVPARDAERLKMGMSVSVEPVDPGGKTYPGRVREVAELARKPDPALAADDFTSDRAVDCVVEVGDAPLRIGSLVVLRFNGEPAR